MSEIKQTMPDIIFAQYCTSANLTWGGWNIKAMPNIYLDTSYTRTDIYATETGNLKAELERFKQSHDDLLKQCVAFTIDKDVPYDLDVAMANAEKVKQQALNKANKSLCDVNVVTQLGGTSDENNFTPLR